MNKREKVLKGLEICKEDSKLCFGESECGYQSVFPRCWKTLAADALALLKALDVTPEELERLKAQEQEPIAPIERSAPAQGANDVWYECRKCGKFLGVNPYSVQLCPKCGRKVKW